MYLVCFKGIITWVLQSLNDLCSFVERINIAVTCQQVPITSERYLLVSNLSCTAHGISTCHIIVSIYVDRQHFKGSRIKCNMVKLV